MSELTSKYAVNLPNPNLYISHCTNSKNFICLDIPNSVIPPTGPSHQLACALHHQSSPPTGGWRVDALLSLSTCAFLAKAFINTWVNRCSVPANITCSGVGRVSVHLWFKSWGWNSSTPMTHRHFISSVWVLPGNDCSGVWQSSRVLWKLRYPS